jgi:hypothetical protein
MKTPEEFLREYLREVDTLHRKYTDYPSSEEQVESVSRSDASALVVTRFASLDGKLRYQLRLAGESWMIAAKEYSCFRCHTTGKKQGTGEICRTCKGAGWLPLSK